MVRTTTYHSRSPQSTPSSTTSCGQSHATETSGTGRAPSAGGEPALDRAAQATTTRDRHLRGRAAGAGCRHRRRGMRGHGQPRRPQRSRRRGCHPWPHLASLILRGDRPARPRRRADPERATAGRAVGGSPAGSGERHPMPRARAAPLPHPRPPDHLCQRRCAVGSRAASGSSILRYRRLRLESTWALETAFTGCTPMRPTASPHRVAGHAGVHTHSSTSEDCGSVGDRSGRRPGGDSHLQRSRLHGQPSRDPTGRPCPHPARGGATAVSPVTTTFPNGLWVRPGCCAAASINYGEA